jgi:iron complex outermembrane receptor protein
VAAQTEYAFPEEGIRILPDTVKLNEVTVTAEKKEHESPFTVTKIKRETLEHYAADDLGTILSRMTPLQLKTYGPGNLATPVFRGTSAAHTQTTWNGLSLNSPMLGQTDFGLLPAFFADEVTVLHGIASLSEGSSGMGGTVILESKPDYTLAHDYTIRLAGGSFGKITGGAQAAFTRGKWFSRTRMQYDQASNDYPYSNTFLSGTNPPVETRQDADWKRLAWGQDIYTRPDKFNTLSFNVWGQNYNRSIPVPISSPAIQGNEWLKQDDIGMVANWNHERPGISSRLSIGGSYNYFDYHQKTGQIESTAATYQAMVRHQGGYDLNPTTRIESAISLGRQQAETRNYEGIRFRNQASLWLQGIKQVGTIAELVTGLRKDLAEGIPTPLLPSFGIKLFPAKTTNFYLSACWAANHRIPTFNDLYWVPGGNPELLPEKGYTTEFSIGYNSKYITTGTLSLRISVYDTRINNWIAWLPDTTGTYWTPRNLKKVHSQGIETLLNFHRQWGASILMADLAWNLTLASDKNNSSGLQLPYTPIHSLRAGVEFVIKKIRLDYNCQYTGKRYVTNNPGQLLPAYSLHEAGAGYGLSAGHHRISVSVRIYNILNTAWQSVIWQPMPGRHFRLMVVYRISRPR